MKNSIFFAVLLLTTTTACSRCLKIEGEYTTHGASEQITRLNILTNNTFILKHEAWEPGAYERKETTSTKGTWSCAKSQITFTVPKLIYNAKYLAIGKNPLEINEKTMVIHFGPNIPDTNDYLNSEIFYPVSSLSAW